LRHGNASCWRGIAAAALLAAGCAARQPQPVDFSEVPRNYRPAEYRAVEGRWTRHGKLWRDIGTVIELWATFKSWDFRQAYIERYAEVYGLPDAERATLKQAQLEAQRAGYELHVTVQTGNYKWNDLDQKDSPWKVTLVDGAGAEIAPKSIELQKLPELYEMEFFPNRTDFSRTYLIRFPRGAAEAEGRAFRGPASGRVTLRVSGPLGRLEVAWDSI
jgi:hypothetical protein